jgi:histone H3/H4
MPIPTGVSASAVETFGDIVENIFTQVVQDANINLLNRNGRILTQRDLELAFFYLHKSSRSDLMGTYQNFTRNDGGNLALLGINHH